MTQADFAAFDCDPLDSSKGIQKNYFATKKTDLNDKNISNFNFELEMQREAQKAGGKFDPQKDH